MASRIRRPKPSGHGKSTLHKGGRAPPKDSVYDIINYLLSYFNKFKKLHEAKRDAEKKYHIRKEADGCWSEDDIRRVWGKTQRMGIISSKRRNWTHVVLLQLIGKHREDLSLLIEGGYIVKRSEDRDELESEYKDGSGGNHTTSDQFWPIYGVRQSSTGAEYLDFDQNTENSPDVPSGHSWKPVEVESENKEDGGTAGGDAQRKPESINSEDRSPQINAELGSVRTAGGDEQSPIYIRIPLAEMLHNEQTLREYEAPPVTSPYKLIDGFPSDTDLRKRKSYAMSFNNRTNNAECVYEILNRETLADNSKPLRFADPYDRGHLAAAGNHLWCREALNDANVNSNIAPQHKRLNSGHWSTLENRCRKLTKEHRTRNVHVYTGPLYLRQMNPPELREKRVPSDFFKVIIVEKVDGTVEHLECYLMPNNEITDRDIVYAKLPPTVIYFIQYIEQESKLKFIERRSNVREERTITARLQGEDPNEIIRDANIEARISH